MSLGLYKHPSLGEVRKYILNNKYVLECKLNPSGTQEWSKRYNFLKETYLKNKRFHFYLFPQEIYLDEEEVQVEGSNKQVKQTNLIITYDHFIITLQEQLKHRMKDKQSFAKAQLWYFLYTLVSGSLEIIDIHQQFNSTEPLDINPETILLNEYGYVKMVGFYSTPFNIKFRSSYKAPEYSMPKETLPNKFELSSSITIGRIIASLVMLEDMDEFYDWSAKHFDQKTFHQHLDKYEQEIGLLYNILKGMISEDIKTRLLLSEIKAILLPYQNDILSLNDFVIEKQISRQSMINLFGGA